MASNLEHFDALTEKGLKIIPVRENSKIPLCKGWSTNWNHDIARLKIKQFPNCNIGLLLGDIVDVEGDSQEANTTIENLIGDYPHPVYRSTKSFHHLFLTPDQSLRHYRVGEIEFRGYGHQSVLPPSHHNGVNYQWLKKFKFPVPQMPGSLLNFYKAQRFCSKNLVKPNHLRVWCSLCEEKNFLHKKRFHMELGVFRILGLKWQCQKCREYDLRSACRLLRGGCPATTILEGFAK